MGREMLPPRSRAGTSSVGRAATSITRADRGRAWRMKRKIALLSSSASWALSSSTSSGAPREDSVRKSQIRW